MHVAILDTFLAFLPLQADGASAPATEPLLGAQLGTDGPDLFRYVLVCGFLVLLIALLGVGFRKLVASGMRARAGRRALQTIDVLPLGGKAKVAVVRCYDKSYLIGIGDKEIRLLDTLEAESTETDEAPELTVLPAGARPKARTADPVKPVKSGPAPEPKPKVARKAGDFLQALKARVGDDAPARAAASDAVKRGAARKKQAAGARERGLPGGGILG